MDKVRMGLAQRVGAAIVRMEIEKYKSRVNETSSPFTKVVPEVKEQVEEHIKFNDNINNGTFSTVELTKFLTEEVSVEFIHDAKCKDIFSMASRIRGDFDSPFYKQKAYNFLSQKCESNNLWVLWQEVFNVLLKDGSPFSAIVAPLDLQVLADFTIEEGVISLHTLIGSPLICVAKRFLKITHETVVCFAGEGVLKIGFTALHPWTCITSTSDDIIINSTALSCDEGHVFLNPGSYTIIAGGLRIVSSGIGSVFPIGTQEDTARLLTPASFSFGSDFFTIMEIICGETSHPLCCDVLKSAYSGNDITPFGDPICSNVNNTSGVLSIDESAIYCT